MMADLVLFLFEIDCNNSQGTTGHDGAGIHVNIIEWVGLNAFNLLCWIKGLAVRHVAK